jgi:hypothetical protein
MTYEDFLKSAHGAEPGPPGGLSLVVQALWWDARGDWEQAHELCQAQDDADGAWVHAYLHRREGDPGNAAYWYRRAGKPVCQDSLSSEWQALARAFLPAVPET